MIDVKDRNPSPQPVVVNNMKVLGAHLFWFFLGPLILALLLWGIAAGGSGWITSLDVAFFVVLAIVIGCRWVDQRSGQGTTSTGEPSTWNQFYHYAMILPIVAVVAWIAANLVGNHL